MGHLLTGNGTGNRFFGIGSFCPVGLRVNVVLLGPAAGVGEDVGEVLAGADDALRGDNALLVDEEGEGGGEDLVALGEAELFLGEDGEAGAGFGGPPARLVGLAVIDDEDLVIASFVDAVELGGDRMAWAAAGLGEDEQDLSAGEVAEGELGARGWARLRLHTGAVRRG